MKYYKGFSIFLLPLFFLLTALPAFSDDTVVSEEAEKVIEKNTFVDVVSPKPGTWANEQSLVLQFDCNTEVYYSLNGSDPLESGFAYDGPVPIDLKGEVTVHVTSICDDVTENFSINYTVVKKDPLNFISQENWQALVEVNSEKGIDIPNSLTYSIGTSTIQNAGRRLQFEKPVTMSSLVPLVIYSGADKYRYVLQTGDESTHIAISPAQSDVVFTDWNFLEFKNGGPVVYSVDGGALFKSDSGHITIDRDSDHTIEWYYLNPTAVEDEQKGEQQTLFVPAKPNLLGIPKNLVSPQAVTIYPDNTDYVLGYSEKESTVYCNELTVDTLFGDGIGFNKEISFYYKEIEQGSIQVTFLVDKIAPKEPKIVSSTDIIYSREDVNLTFESEFPVYYAIAEPLVSEAGFYVKNNNLQKFSLPEVADADFKQCIQKSIVLTSNDSKARLFTVYAYSKDLAGNTSNKQMYRVIIDKANYYVVKDEVSVMNDTESDVTTVQADGTPSYPYSNLDCINEFASSKDKKIVHVSGQFTSLPLFKVTGDITIIGDGETRFEFKPDCGMYVQNGSLYIRGCTIQSINYTDDDMFRKYMINATKSKLILIDCELVARPGKSGSAINLVDSSISVANTGITVQAISYVSAINADNSQLILKGLRTVVVGQTAVGISLSKGICSIDLSTLSILSDLPRAVELVNSSVILRGSEYISKKSIDNTPAIWHDLNSQILLNENNKVTGFSELLAE